MMWTLFMVMIIIKGLSYALNNPTKEVIYIPTTKDIRFKAKGWIESFGGRTAKAGGSVINAAFAKNLPEVLIKSNKVAAGAAVWQKIQLGFLLRLRSPQSASSVELCTMLYILYNVQYTQTYDTPISELIKVNYCTKLIPFQNLCDQLITEHCNKKYFAKKYIVQPHIERK